MSEGRPMQATATKSKGEKRRAEMLQAARSRLIERGHAAFSIREVASDLGTKLGHVQYYFPSKHDLLEALVRDEFRMNLAVIDKIVGGNPATKSTLETIVRTLVNLWMSEGARVYVVMPFLALHDKMFRALNREINDKFFQVIEQLLRETNHDDPADVRAAKARMITAIMDGGLLHVGASTTLEDEIVATVLLIVADFGKN